MSIFSLSGKPENPWARRARLLDRYHWQVLRSRHGRAGSALRFARDALISLVLGGWAHCRLARTLEAGCCDFLLLQASPKVQRLQRKRALVDQLRQRGHQVVDTVLLPPADLLACRQLLRPPQPVPLRYFLQAAHAWWLVNRYRPAILLNDRNGSYYSPFLRLALQVHQGLLVQLAHSSTLENARRLGMNDYDYYFLFGQSSLQALQQRPLRLGSSRAVLSGSYLVDRRYVLPPARLSRCSVLVLGLGPDKEKEAGYQYTYRLLLDWAVQQPDCRMMVKLHPRSRGGFWRQAALAQDNLQILPADSDLAWALERATLVISIMSNAVLEAALAGRPVLYVNASGEADLLEQARFFGEAIRDVRTLQQRLGELEQPQAHAWQVARSADFVRHHLAHGTEGLAQTLTLLEQLLHQGHCAGVELPAAGPGLV